MPSIGRLAHYIPPPASDTVRVDTGIKAGSEVSMFYDPMIAKLITYGDTRDEAIDQMHKALDQYYIRGVSHNISFLNALIAHPRFKSGELTTNFIAEEYPDGFHASDTVPTDPMLPIAVAAAVHRAYVDRASNISNQLKGHERIINDQFVVCVDKHQTPVSVVAVDGGFEINIDTMVFRIVTKWQIGEHLFHAEVNGQHVCFQLDRDGVSYQLLHRGSETNALVLTPRAAELSQYMLEKVQPDLSKYLLSPMPGLLVRLTVAAGDTVKAGEELAVVEAMKMENSLRANDDVVVAKVLAEQGETLAVDQPILEFE